MPEVLQITPAQALQQQAAGALLIDIRQPHEQAAGMAAAALAVPMEQLLDAPHEVLAAHGAAARNGVLLICQRGMRSQLAAEALHKAIQAGAVAAGTVGGIASVIGGTEHWQAQGLPMQLPENAPDADFLQRYARQMRLPQVGLAGQQRLADARVVLIGAGGLGAPAAFYLAAAGVGHLRIVDDDVVERSNLQRQIVHVDAGIGQAKVNSAKARLQALNPRVHIEAMQVRASADTIDALLADADVLVDGADNFAVRYLLNEAALQHRLPLVYGAVQQFTGQVSVFDAGRLRGQAPCYRCLFPEPPAAADAPNCAEAGVFGVLPGVIGLLQATEVLKLLLGIGTPLIGRLLRYDALQMQFRHSRLPVDANCPCCAPDRVFSGYDEIQHLCALTH